MIVPRCYKLIVPQFPQKKIFAKKFGQTTTTTNNKHTQNQWPSLLHSGLDRKEGALITFYMDTGCQGSRNIGQLKVHGICH